MLFVIRKCIIDIKSKEGGIDMVEERVDSFMDMLKQFERYIECKMDRDRGEYLIKKKKITRKFMISYLILKSAGNDATDVKLMLLLLKQLEDFVNSNGNRNYIDGRLVVEKIQMCYKGIQFFSGDPNVSVEDILKL